MLHQELFFGIIFFQLLFIVIQWSLFKRAEYGYYSFYILAIAAYFLIKYITGPDQYAAIGSFRFNSLVPDKSLSFLAFGFYIKFGRKFLETENRYPVLNKRIIILENFIIAYALLNFIFVALTHDFVIEGYCFAAAFGIVFILSIVLLFKLLKVYPLSKYLIAGSFLVALGACLALYIGLTQPKMGIGSNDTTIYLQIGVLLDFICLNIGLVYKTKMLQTQALEKQKAIELERMRISTELHDDLGGELSAIRLLSEMNISTISPHQQLSKISASSGELIQKMNEIVWALNVNNDSLQGLIAYMRRYAVKCLDDAGIDCIFKQPEKIPDIEVDGITRRNIFLLLKEVLNNVVKHAHAKEVKIKVTINDALQLTIHDNGKGIPDGTLQNGTGNGFRNMQQRVKDLKGSMEIKNHNGTMVLFVLPFLGITQKGD